MNQRTRQIVAIALVAILTLTILGTLLAVLVAPANGEGVGTAASTTTTIPGTSTSTGTAATTSTASMRVGYQTTEVAPDGDFTMLLDIGSAPAGSELVVRIYDRIDSPELLLASAGQRPKGLKDTFDAIPLAATAVASQPAHFTINLYQPGQPRPPGSGAWAYNKLTEAGAYPIEVQLRDRNGDVLTAAFTYLVRQPQDPSTIHRTPVGLLTTVHAPTAVSHTRRVATDQASPLLLRRLGPVLAAYADHPKLPTSFAVTADDAVHLAGDAAAHTVLAQLRAELQRSGRELIGSPYVPIQAAALVHAGLAGEVARQNDLGGRALTTTLQEPVTDTWYLGQRLDDATVQVLRQQGITRLVVPTDAVAGAPNAVSTLTNKGLGVHASTVAGSFDVGKPRTSDPRLDAYRVLGELAAVSSIQSTDAALTLRVDATTVDPTELGVLLDGLAASSDFVRPVNLSGLFGDATASPQVATLATPRSVNLGSYPARSNGTHQLVSSYASMVKDQPQRVDAFDRPLAISASSDLSLTQRERDLTRIQGDLLARFRSISAPARDTVTLGARDAKFPLIIRSTLDYPVDVVIQLSASDRLKFPEDHIQATVKGDRTIVPIRVQTRGSGDTPLVVTTRTPDGRVILAETRYTVRSTAVSGVGILLTIGAGLFLALWWGRHWLRHRTRARHARSRFRRPAAPGPTAPM